MGPAVPTILPIFNYRVGENLCPPRRPRESANLRDRWLRRYLG